MTRTSSPPTVCGWPTHPGLVRLAVSSRDEVLAAVQSGRPPYDEVTPQRWLAMLDEQVVR
jgi:hypothetical protein